MRVNPPPPPRPNRRCYFFVKEVNPETLGAGQRTDRNVRTENQTGALILRGESQSAGRLNCQPTPQSLPHLWERESFVSTVIGPVPYNNRDVYTKRIFAVTGRYRMSVSVPISMWCPTWPIPLSPTTPTATANISTSKTVFIPAAT